MGFCVFGVVEFFFGVVCVFIDDVDDVYFFIDLFLESVFCGVVVCVDWVVDGFVFEMCVVGGDDVIDVIVLLYDFFDCEDVCYLFVFGIVLVWFNFVDIDCFVVVFDCLVFLVFFEESEGFEFVFIE